MSDPDSPVIPALAQLDPRWSWKDTYQVACATILAMFATFTTWLEYTSLPSYAYYGGANKVAIWVVAAIIAGATIAAFRALRAVIRWKQRAADLEAKAWRIKYLDPQQAEVEAALKWLAEGHGGFVTWSFQASSGTNAGLVKLPDCGAILLDGRYYVVPGQCVEVIGRQRQAPQALAQLLAAARS